ncbi:MAG: SEC-C domain-containing protein [Arcobacteraceae bacterium]|nr:SEC-C domain-containing protein [Arcobacteraceae bacterium]MDY0327322.1 YchJ family metal-binding protein [Arcobacteraceae bacterium]
MKFSVNSKCPCGSGNKYKNCCQVFHKGAIAKNALFLMKSRYSAYVVGDVNYIIKTTHQENKEYKQDLQSWKKEIKSFSDETEFVKLEIFDFQDGELEAFVTFRVNMKIDDTYTFFTEVSRFVHLENRWLYIDGEFINQ